MKTCIWKTESVCCTPETNTMLVNQLLSRFSRVRPCATPQKAAHQAPLSLGFSRQEHWSGLPFPSPMQESASEVASIVSNSVRPHRQQPIRLLGPWDFPGKSTGVGCPCLLRLESELCLNEASALRSYETLLQT